LHPDGTTIPMGWVEPVEPSSKEWEKFLQKPLPDGAANSS